MIEVNVTHTSGLHDTAEADTPEGAVLAARTLFDEMRDANPIQGFHRGITTTFIVDEKIVHIYAEGTRP